MLHCQDGIELSDDLDRSATTSGRRCCPGGSPQIARLRGNLIGGVSGEQPEGRNFAVAKGWNYDQEGSSDPHPIIPIRPVKIQYTPSCYSCCTHTHTYTPTHTHTHARTHTHTHTTPYSWAAPGLLPHIHTLRFFHVRGVWGNEEASQPLRRRGRFEFESFGTQSPKSFELKSASKPKNRGQVPSAKFCLAPP